MTQHQPAEGTAPVALQYCQITATDLDESLLFYRDALGLELHKDLGAGVSRWVTLGSPAQPGLVFVLFEAARRPFPGRR